MRNRRWSRLAVFLFLVGVAGVSFAGTITLDNSKIPPSPGTLKRLKNSRANAPSSFVQEVLATSHPNSKLEGLAQSQFAQKHGINAAKNVQAAIDNDHVVATIDPSSGHADVMPDLTNLAPRAKANDPKSPPPTPQGAADQAQTAAQNMLRRGLFPSDSTHANLGKGLTLNASQFTAGTAGAPPAFVSDKSGPIMMSFPVQRLVGNVPVVGRGSRGVIHVAANGKVHGFSRHWQNGTDNDTVTDTRTPGQIGDLIRQQLAGLAAKGDVVVQDVSLAYYDGDKGYIQPVYQFHAKVSVTPASGGIAQTDDDFVTGYIPFGTDKAPLESIPSLTDKPGNNPNVPQGARKNLPLSQLMPIEPPAQTAAMPPREVPRGDPTIGRYVVRNDDWGWVDS